MANVMVTGARSELGAGIARQFACRENHMTGVPRRRSLLKDLQVELIALGASCAEFCVVGLADAQQVQDLSNDLPQLGIDVLINNPALGHWNYVWDTTPDIMRSMLAVDVSAVAVLTTAFSRCWHQQPARLMNVTSDAGYALFEEAIPYSATKFFVTALTEGLARELASQNHPMRAQLLVPGPIATEIQFHTAAQVAGFTMQLFDREAMVGACSRI